MTLFVITTVSFLASLLTLFSGFGLGTLLMPVVAIFFPVAVAIALTAFVHFLNNVFKLMTLWRHIHWRVSFTFGIPALLAAIPGAWLLTKLSTSPEITRYTIGGMEAIIEPVKLAVGLLLLIFATAEWIHMAKKADIAPKWLPVGGLLSGFFGGLSGHQGAFRSAFLLHAKLNPSQFIATNAVIASLVDMTRLTLYGLNLKLLMAQVDTSVLLTATVAAFAGVLAGKVGIKKVTIGMIQRLVAIMLYVLGIALISGII